MNYLRLLLKEKPLRKSDRAASFWFSTGDGRRHTDTSGRKAAIVRIRDDVTARRFRNDRRRSGRCRIGNRREDLVGLAGTSVSPSAVEFSPTPMENDEI